MPRRVEIKWGKPVQNAWADSVLPHGKHWYKPRDKSDSICCYFQSMQHWFIPNSSPWCRIKGMGIIEFEARKRRRRRNIQHAILASIGIVGILSVAMIAPNIFQAIPRIAGDKYKLKYRAETAAGRLVQKGLARFVTRKGIRCIELTEKGSRTLVIERAKYALDTRYKRWDKRYRLVMFDVPHYRRNVRDRLRRMMRECGFLQVQKSVWVYPHDCEELLGLIKAELRIGKDVLYAVVESLENDAWIKRHFGLKG